MIKYSKRDLETLKKLATCLCVRSTNSHWSDLPDMAHSSTIKRLVRMGLAEYIYREGFCSACWTGLGSLTEKGKRVLEDHERGYFKQL